MSGPGSLLLALPLPRDALLKVAFENDARSLQKFVTRLESREWPAPEAPPHAQVTDTQVLVWYGSGSYSDAVLAWRPIDLSDGRGGARAGSRCRWPSGAAARRGPRLSWGLILDASHASPGRRCRWVMRGGRVPLARLALA
jgi:hypothetical protein